MNRRRIILVKRKFRLANFSTPFVPFLIFCNNRTPFRQGKQIRILFLQNFLWLCINLLLHHGQFFRWHPETEANEHPFRQHTFHLHHLAQCQAACFETREILASHIVFCIVKIETNPHCMILKCFPHKWHDIGIVIMIDNHRKVWRKCKKVLLFQQNKILFDIFCEFLIDWCTTFLSFPTTLLINFRSTRIHRDMNMKEITCCQFLHSRIKCNAVRLYHGRDMRIFSANEIHKFIAVRRNQWVTARKQEELDL